MKVIQIYIPQPCHEKWNEMTATEKGRFCNACQKVVVDFSSMSDTALLQYMAKIGTGERICGRFTNDQLQRDIVPLPERKKGWLLYAWQLLLAILFFTNRSSAQIKLPNDTIATTAPLVPVPELVGRLGSMVVAERTTKAIPVTFHGIVVDAAGNGIPGATVILRGTNGGAVADSAGHFKLTVAEKQFPLKLEASSIGYQTVQMPVKRMNVDRPGRVVTIVLSNESFTTGADKW